jgi:Arv1-like family
MDVLKCASSASNVCTVLDADIVVGQMSNEEQVLEYRCIECGTVATSLFKAYPRNAFKLTICVSCGMTVDPYVERDYALVVLDCALVRIRAFRHVLWNTKWEITNMIQCLIIVCLLQSALYSQTSWIKAQIVSRDIEFSTLMIYHISILCSQIVIAYWSFNDIKSSRHKPSILQVGMAILLPFIFSAVILFLLVWENSLTVKLLGRFMEIMYQLTAIQVIGGDIILFLTILSLRILLSATLMNLFELPCLGIVWSPSICILA